MFRIGFFLLLITCGSFSTGDRNPADCGKSDSNWLFGDNAPKDQFAIGYSGIMYQAVVLVTKTHKMKVDVDFPGIGYQGSKESNAERASRFSYCETSKKIYGPVNYTCTSYRDVIKFAIQMNYTTNRPLNASHSGFTFSLELEGKKCSIENVTVKACEPVKSTSVEIRSPANYLQTSPILCLQPWTHLKSGAPQEATCGKYADWTTDIAPLTCVNDTKLPEFIPNTFPCVLFEGEKASCQHKFKFPAIHKFDAKVLRDGVEIGSENFKFSQINNTDEWVFDFNKEAGMSDGGKYDLVLYQKGYTVSPFKTSFNVMVKSTGSSISTGLAVFIGILVGIFLGVGSVLGLKRLRGSRAIPCLKTKQTDESMGNTTVDEKPKETDNLNPSTEAV